MDRNSKEFRDLQKKWYGKLKKAEFKDIERPDGTLELWTCSFFKTRYNETLFSAKEEYYRLASQLLHSHSFQDKKEMLMWQMHSEGISVRNIVKTLKAKKFKVSKDTVHAVIKRLANLMLKR